MNNRKIYAAWIAVVAIPGANPTYSGPFATPERAFEYLVNTLKEYSDEGGAHGHIAPLVIPHALNVYVETRY